MHRSRPPRARRGVVPGTAVSLEFDLDAYEPGPFARDLARMIEAGARVVGGCCGTDAGHVQAMRTVIDAVAMA